jgi:hypothetical protein
MIMSRVSGLAVVLVMLIGRCGFADDEADAQPPVVVQEAPEASEADGDGHGDRPAALSELRQEHIIYLPFEKLSEVFGQEDASILLPYAKYLEMWNRLTRPEPLAIEPPVEGVIARADYAGAVRGDLVHLEATLAVEVLGAGWARLPVEFGDAAVGSAVSEDGTVLLRGAGQGRYELLVQGQGRHTIRLNLVAGVQTAAEGRSFTLQCPVVGVSNLELEIPEPQLAVHVTPRRTFELRADREDATGVRAVLGATDRFTVSWHPASGVADLAAGLANVSSTIAVDVGDGVVHTHVVFDYQILRGALDELLVDAPADQRLLDIQAAGLRDWQTEVVQDRQQVRVRLHAPVTGSVRLELHTESPLPDEAFQVGHVRAVGVARESGILAVRSAEDVGLEFVVRQSLARVDATDVPEPLRRPRSTYYKFFTSDHQLTLVASARQSRIVVDSHFAVLVDKAKTTTQGEFRYQISRSGIFALSFRLPPGIRVDDVRSESLERFDITPGEDSQTLNVYFARQVLGELAVRVTASQARGQAAGSLELLLPEPLDVLREEGLVAVIAPESLEVATDAEQLIAARTATPAELATQGFQPRIPAGSTLASAFAFVRRPVHIVQTIAERPRRVLATVSTAATLSEDVVQVTTAIQWQVRFAGTDMFRLAVPAAVSDRLQIEGESIRERRRAEQPGEDGWTEWTIVLHSETLGDVAFTATYDQPLSLQNDRAQLLLQPIRVPGADRETGQITIHKDRVLSVEATPTGLEEIDPRELSLPPATGPPYLAYRYYRHPAELTLHMTRHEVQDVVRTVVRRAYVEAVVTRDGPVTMRARYDVTSSERQRLALTLHNPRILSMAVAGQTVLPEIAPAASGNGPEDRTYFINVARAGETDEPFEIAAVFETPGPADGMDITDALRLALPRFDHEVKFQKTYVRVWVPRDYRLVGDPDGFTSHIGVGLWDSRAITPAAEDPDTWFPPDASPFDTDGTPYLFSSLEGPAELWTAYWHIPTMTFIASAIALALGVVLLRFSLEAKVFTVLAVALMVVFFGLFWPSVINSWLLAARLGIAAVISLWLVAWFLYVHRTGVIQQALAAPGAARGGVGPSEPGPAASPFAVQPTGAPAAEPSAPEAGEAKGGSHEPQ